MRDPRALRQRDCVLCGEMNQKSRIISHNVRESGLFFDSECFILFSVFVLQSHAGIGDFGKGGFEIYGNFVGFEAVAEIAGICKADGDEVVLHLHNGGFLSFMEKRGKQCC